MKKSLLLSALMLSGGLCLAQELGRVISATPVVQQLGVTRQVCPAEQTAPQNCASQVIYENRVVGFNVVYEFAGKQYSVQMPGDPGPTVQLQVGPAEAVADWTPAAGSPTYVAPLVEQPVYIAGPRVYPGYYQPNYVWPLFFGLGLGYLGGYYGHPHLRGHRR